MLDELAAAGYTDIWTSEVNATDAFAPLLMAAQRVPRLRLGTSIAGSAIWTQRGPLMAERRWFPAPGPVRTLHPILEQIEEHAASIGLSASVFAAAKEVFDQALADGWGDLDIACVHDQVNQ